MSALILAGDVYIKQATDAGFYKICPADSFTVSVAAPDKKEIRSKCRANYNALMAAYSFPGKHSLKIEAQAFDKRAFAMAFLGTSADDTVATASTSASLTLALDIWTVVGTGEKCTSISIASKVEGTDYVVDLEAGLIKPLLAGTTGAQTVAYVVTATTGYTISAQTVTGIVAEVMLVGKNLLTNEMVKFLAPNVTLSPSGDINFLAQDMNKFTLDGDIVVPAGGTIPYTMVIRS